MQMDMFKLIDDGFCFDQDINNIIDMLDEITEKYEMVTETKKEWGIWEHVPSLGYRLSYYLYFNEHLPDEMFVELEKVIDYAKTRKIKLELFGYFFRDKEGSMSIYSIYEDQRIKLK